MGKDVESVGEEVDRKISELLDYLISKRFPAMIVTEVHPISNNVESHYICAANFKRDLCDDGDMMSDLNRVANCFFGNSQDSETVVRLIRSMSDMIKSRERGENLKEHPNDNPTIDPAHNTEH